LDFSAFCLDNGIKLGGEDFFWPALAAGALLIDAIIHRVQGTPPVLYIGEYHYGTKIEGSKRSLDESRNRETPVQNDQS